MDNAHQEMLVTIQHDSAIVTYRKEADAKESPIRVLQGNKTGIADPHGIVIDPKTDDDLRRQLRIDARHQRDHREADRRALRRLRRWQDQLAARPRIRDPRQRHDQPPSIVVHRRSDRGNAARAARHPGSQRPSSTGRPAWRSTPTRRELYVANDAGASVLVFDATASGNVAPKRVLQGAKTSLANPTSVFVDAKNKELWVANFGGHT